MSAVGRIAPASVRRVPARCMLLPAGPAIERAPATSTGSREIHAPEISGLRPESAVAALVDHAVRLGASDLFFSFNDNHVAVAVRLLGIVRLLTILTTDHGRRCTSYIKAMAGMDLAEQS
jgi:type II secretory ATPase GspE/PulE/Tfp pilus assembly ATPase PilB-like protein